MFSYCGFDYAGPAYVKSIYAWKKSVMYEACIASFTCVNSSQAYLDLVLGYASKYYADVLKWFISTRGVPKIVISDNGS